MRGLGEARESEWIGGCGAGRDLFAPPLVREENRLRSKRGMQTVRITGIEDPQVLQKPVHAFFEFGWRELTALIKRNPWDRAMAVNNKSVRTQDQLHVHLGCVRDDIRTNLDHASLSNQWSDIKLHGHPFIALQVDSLSRSSFEILQAYLVSKGEQIGDYSLAVVGRDHGKFVLLATRSAAEL